MLLYVITLLFTSLFSSISASLLPAKRQLTPLTIQDICGPDASDCGSGYCCEGGTECIDNDPPLCRDLIYSDATIEAQDYSSLISVLNFDGLTSLGLTISTFPTTLTEGNIFSTGLPSYSDNVLSTSGSEGHSAPSRTRASTVAAQTSSPSSTGAAVLPTANLCVLVGGMIGAGVLVGF